MEPANSFGSYWIARSNQRTFYQIGTWNTDATTLNIHTDHSAGYTTAASGLNFQAMGNAAYGANTVWGFQIITP